MVLAKISTSNERLHCGIASRYITDSPPKYKLPEKSIQPESAYRIISSELELDGKPGLNMATFVTTWMEPEADKLLMEALNKNYIDFSAYPVTTDIQNRCVNIIANLFNAPAAPEGNENGPVGVGTAGSSEAAMLAGLACKRKWQNYKKGKNLPSDKPNMVAGADMQVCWEKFANYFEVELRVVPVSEGYYVMDPNKAVEMVDENTIFVVAILGSTMSGEFENVELLNELLTEKNKEFTDQWEVPIHVDAASGGFVAPFIYPDLEWDFRLPLVKSINVSGHKYGLVYAGVGWVVWRSKDDLPDDLIYNIDYLGTSQETFTLNFSKSASQILGQYYQFLRLGQEGYTKIIRQCKVNATALAIGIRKTGLFNIISKVDGLPVVTFSPKDQSKYDVYKISDSLRMFGWIVPAYKMPQNADNILVLRAVIRENFTRALVDRLVSDIIEVTTPADDTADVDAAIRSSGIC